MASSSRTTAQLVVLDAVGPPEPGTPGCSAPHTSFSEPHSEVLVSGRDRLFTVSLFLTGAPCPPPGESPFGLLGRVIMQQSYVCALIAMMVRTGITDLRSPTDTKRSVLPCCAGVEHHVPQLADVCVTTVGVSHLDPAHKVLLLISAMGHQGEGPRAL